VAAHLEAGDAPWEALRCLVGEAAYGGRAGGGRAGGGRERRALGALLGRLLCEAAAAPGAALTRAPGYTMPDGASPAGIKARRQALRGGPAASLHAAGGLPRQMYAMEEPA